MTVEAVNNRVTALATKLDNLEDELAEERSRREQLEAKLAQREERIDELECRLAAVDDRTDLLDLVEHADDTSGKQRSLALIQHLKRKAEQRTDDDTDAVAAVTRDRAEEVLHHPDVHRTTIYDDMRRAVRLVGDEDILSYDDAGERRLKLNLEAGALPTEVLAPQSSEVSR